MWRVKKDSLESWIWLLGRQARILLPRGLDGAESVKGSRHMEEMGLIYPTSMRPPKEFLFPPSQTMLIRQNEELTSPSADLQTRIILGVRPCDASALVALDCVFLEGEYQDVYYAAKRERTVLVGLGCTDPPGTCFCTLVGGGPLSTAGLDLLLTDIGSCYVASAVTEKGEELVGKDWEEATPEDLGLLEKVRTQAEKELPPAARLDIIRDKLDTMIEDEIWSRLHEKCVGCAACTYLCPTCHCFDVLEEGSGPSEGRRVRNWDSCMFPLFTLHASGHNPRPTGRERMRQRVMHKFNYFPHNSGLSACVGCGRCIDACPVNIDIRRILAEIA